MLSEIGMFVDRREHFVWDTDLSKWSDEQVKAVTEFMLRQEYGDDVEAIEAAKRQALIDAGAWSLRQSQLRSRSRFGLSRVPRATFQRLLCVALAPGVEQAMSRSGHALPLCKLEARTLFRQHHPATTDISAVA